MQIYPSILEKSADDLINKLEKQLPYFNHFQIDITDGKFVPNKTVQIEEISSTIERLNNRAIKQKFFEFHLMVNDYQIEIAKLNQLVNFINIKCVFIHLQVLSSTFYPPSSSFKYGIVLNPDESVADNWETIRQFNIVQLMTVYPGKQGSPFIPEALAKIDQLRNLGFKGNIILDGAMNDKTLPIVLRQKFLPDAICPGSYFSQDIKQRLTKLQELINNHSTI